MFLWQSYHLLMADQDHAGHVGVGTGSDLLAWMHHAREKAPPPRSNRLSLVKWVLQQRRWGAGEAPGLQETDGTLHRIPIDRQWAASRDLQGMMQPPSSWHCHYARPERTGQMENNLHRVLRLDMRPPVRLGSWLDLITK